MQGTKIRKCPDAFPVTIMTEGSDTGGESYTNNQMPANYVELKPSHWKQTMIMKQVNFDNICAENATGGPPPGVECLLAYQSLLLQMPSSTVRHKIQTRIKRCLDELIQ